MTTSTSATLAQSFDITIDIAARPETVFRFLTAPDAFKEWMGPHSTIDPASGALTVIYPNGDHAVGQVLESDPPHRIVFGWGYQDAKYGIAPGTTRVIVSLVATSGGTRLTLRHEGLPSENLRKQHEQGWRYYLGVLGGASAAAQVRWQIADTLRDYARAWNTDDFAERREALQRSCEEDVTYEDRMTATRGLPALLAHVSGVRPFTPGLMLEVTGTPRQCHRHLHYDWRIVGAAPDQIVAQGSATARLSLDGRLEQIVSFWA